MKRCGSRSHFSWTDLIFKMHTRYFSVELLHCSGCNGSITAASIKVKLDRLTTNGCYWRQWDKIRQFNKISILAFCRRLKLPPSCVGVSPPSGGNGRDMPSGPWPTLLDLPTDETQSTTPPTPSPASQTPPELKKISTASSRHPTCAGSWLDFVYWLWSTYQVNISNYISNYN